VFVAVGVSVGGTRVSVTVRVIDGVTVGTASVGVSVGPSAVSVEVGVNVPPPGVLEGTSVTVDEGVLVGAVTVFVLVARAVSIAVSVATGVTVFGTV